MCGTLLCITLLFSFHRDCSTRMRNNQNAMHTFCVSPQLNRTARRSTFTNEMCARLVDSFELNMERVGIFDHSNFLAPSRLPIIIESHFTECCSSLTPAYHALIVSALLSPSFFLRSVHTNYFPKPVRKFSNYSRRKMPGSSR